MEFHCGLYTGIRPSAKGNRAGSYDGGVARLRVGMGVMAAAIAGALVIGCGGGTNHASTTAPRVASTPPTSPQRPAPHPRRTGRVSRTRGVGIRVPYGWHAAHPATHARTWPVPLKVAASFRLPRLSGNAACSRAVIDALTRTPHGVYVLVAEYTKPQPAGFPSPPPLRPRGDLAHLDLRPAEIECWDGGLSGAARFTDHGRAFYVEVLLGHDVTAAERRRALHTLASLRVGRG
jgi:hypothetical protein